MQKLKVFILLFLLVLPASTNYSLRDYGYGGGGEDNATSANYALFSILGESNEDQLQGTTYDLGPGTVYTQLAHVPTVSLTNSSSYYNKLLATLGIQSNPTDTTYSIAISTDNFVTTNYVQADGTIGATAIFRTYSAWGSGSGAWVIGLTSSTTYKTKANAYHGKFSQSGFGPESSATTSAPTLTFDIDISPTDSDTEPPFTVAFGSLTAGSVTTATDRIWIDFATNAQSGGRVYIKAVNGGLLSSATSHTISSATADLSLAGDGFGLRGASAAESSGGPFALVSPYNGASDNVGVVDSSFREVFQSTVPVTGGRGSLYAKAKPTSVTPAATDYSETFTIIASATY